MKDREWEGEGMRGVIGGGMGGSTRPDCRVTQAPALRPLHKSALTRSAAAATFQQAEQWGTARIMYYHPPTRNEPRGLGPWARHGPALACYPDPAGRLVAAEAAGKAPAQLAARQRPRAPALSAALAYPDTP